MQLSLIYLINAQDRINEALSMMKKFSHCLFDKVKKATRREQKVRNQ